MKTMILEAMKAGCPFAIPPYVGQSRIESSDDCSTMKTMILETMKAASPFSVHPYGGQSRVESSDDSSTMKTMILETGSEPIFNSP